MGQLIDYDSDHEDDGTEKGFRVTAVDHKAMARLMVGSPEATVPMTIAAVLDATPIEAGTTIDELIEQPSGPNGDGVHVDMRVEHHEDSISLTFGRVEIVYDKSSAFSQLVVYPLDTREIIMSISGSSIDWDKAKAVTALIPDPFFTVDFHS